jgi:hypothetical protein
VDEIGKSGLEHLHLSYGQVGQLSKSCRWYRINRQEGGQWLMQYRFGGVWGSSVEP